VATSARRTAKAAKAAQHRRPRRARTRGAGPDAERAARAFAQLVRLMTTLRSPRGCPWDRRQTPRSLRPFLLEEAYEALEAIDRGDAETLRGELGDVLFQCVFQAQIAAENGSFDIADSVQAIADKLIRRHPHVFTADGRPLPASRRSSQVNTPSAVLTQWEAIKAGEQRSAGDRPRLLAGVPRALPALVRAHEIGTRAASVGFEWPTTAGVMDKIDEETRELRGALEESPARAAEEMGDLLFAIANLARRLGIEPESALREANDKFTSRFGAVEDRLHARGRTVHEATLDELEAEWTVVKSGRGQPASTSGQAPSTIRTITPSLSTLIAPSRSVRNTSVPIRRSRSITSGDGWPNALPRPTLIKAA
jgi:MazG family protein